MNYSLSTYCFFLTLVMGSLTALSGQAIVFEYTGPDTIYVDPLSCNASLDWGHPDTPSASSNLPGGSIDTFYLFSITGGYQIGSMVGYGELVQITYWAEDNFGNIDLFQFTIYFEDNHSPAFEEEPQNEISSCEWDVYGKLIEWYEDNAGATAALDCSDAEIILQPSLDSAITLFTESMEVLCGSTGSVDLTIFVQDGAGNKSDSIVVNYSSVDIQKPMIVFTASNLTVNCDQNTPLVLKNWIDNVGNASATDNCSDSLNWYLFVWSDSEGNDGQGIPGSGPYPAGYLTGCNWYVNVSFFVRDECNNFRATTGTFSTLDNSPPYFLSTVNDTTVECSQIPDGSSVLAFDNCLGVFAPDITDVTNQLGDLNDCSYYNYTIERTFFAQDACGKDTSYVQIITVIDTIGPFFLAPDDITINCTEDPIPMVTGVPEQLYDPCNSPYFIAYQDTEVGDACEMNITREWNISDACGNETSRTQLITVADLNPPEFINLPKDTMVNCNDELSIMDGFLQWVYMKGGSSAADDCSLATSFVALPGTYDLENPFTFPGDLPETIDFVACQSSADNIIRSVEMAFVYYDDCGNANEKFAVFAVIDTFAPLITNCPPNITKQVSPNNCEITIAIEIPEAYDECSVAGSPYIFEESKQILPSIPGDPTSPVATLNFQIGPVTGIVEQGAIPVLSIDFQNVDMDDSLEYFIIYGEGGVVLDTSPYTLQQCGDTFLIIQNIDHELALEWLEDQYIDISLVPYTEAGIGNFAINNVCGGSSAKIIFSIDMVGEYILSYEVALNGGERMPINFNNPNQFSLESGTHNLHYYVTDCAGNVDSCSSIVEIIDEVPPMLFCPPNQQIILETGECTAEYDVIPPIGFSDNCGPEIIYSQTLPESGSGFLNFYFVPEINGYNPDSIIYTFTNVGANALSDDALLILDYLLDGNDPGEFFYVKGEDGSVLGTTQAGNPNVNPSNCVQEGSATFMISSELFNEWAGDGLLEIRLIPNTDYNNDFGINPCNPLAVQMDGDSDAVSHINANLTYGQSFPSFYVSGATEIPVTNFNNPEFSETIELNGGSNIMHFIYSDASGNKDTCMHQILVLDLESPDVVCQEVILFANPSGVVDVILDPEFVNNGSSDNCGIEEMYVVPDTFNCTQVDNQYVVTLFVTDLSGNSASCETIVRIEAEPLTPQYSASICGADTLKLFANVVLPYPDFQYTYQWTGPNAFTSNEENPVIPNAGEEYSGTFVLTVEGFNGCTATGTVEVFIQELGTPELSVDDDQICIGDPILFETQGYTGNISYHWYEGTYPNGQLLGSTLVPSFIVNPSLGNHLYYLIVEGTNCTSNPSGTKEVTVSSYPVASVCDAFLTLCEGETITLCTTEQGPAYNYNWTGPNGYQGAGQNPASIENVSEIHAGDYKLVINNGICASVPAVTQVSIVDKPAIPFIIGAHNYCEGDAIILTVSNVTNGDLYFWNRNGVSWPPQSSNSLIIPNANVNQNGNWSVAVQKGLCISDTSNVFNVVVEPSLSIIANNSGPVCEGENVQLNSSFVPGASYYWQGPNGFTSNAMSPNVPAVEGLYNLTVTTSASCENTASTFVEIANAPLITALSSNATVCMDGDTDVTLFPTVWPPNSNYNYSWTGPGFSAIDEFPVISNFDSGNSGEYILLVSNENCTSKPDTLSIIVKDQPAQAEIIDFPEFVCEGDSIILVSNFYAEGTEYTWGTPGGNKKTFINTYIDPAAVNNDEGTYSLQVKVDGCISEISESIQIEVKPLPETILAGGSGTYCAGDTIFLSAEFIEGATYEWNGPGFSSNDQNPQIIDVNSQNQGWYQVRIILEDCPSLWSNPVIVNVVELTEILKAESMDTQVCLDDENTLLELCVSESTAIPGANYQWYNALNDELIVSTQDLCTELQDLSLFSAGIEGAYVIASVSGCETAPSDPLLFEFFEIPGISADAGIDIINCEDQNIFLDAELQDGTQGKWTSNPLNTILNHEDPATQVILHDEGFHSFIWTLSNGACKDFSADTVLVYQPQIIMVEDDIYEAENGQILALDLFQNDSFGDSILFFLADPVHWGELNFSNLNNIVYQADEQFTGVVHFSYVICDPYCSDRCVEAEVQINVGEVEACRPYNLITPNSDGVNDYLNFPCLEINNTGSASLLIFNQWGDEIFRSASYQNEWDGYYKGNPLPAGTYYYIFKAEANADAVYGFIIIEY